MGVDVLLLLHSEEEPTRCRRPPDDPLSVRGETGHGRLPSAFTSCKRMHAENGLVHSSTGDRIDSRCLRDGASKPVAWRLWHRGHRAGAVFFTLRLCSGSPLAQLLTLLLAAVF
ncbi:hypothetical protein HPB50_010125 [Hyalomma asiaticum]|uniref:Uncharacterized protein n=1 Tax=Hyalomma asiaticum TaxID=266040 RepID=A0ACB7TE75_HYAAI|nr:hypothetical protein HPB50_010125 [Hyalomma asiaticum]